MNLELDEAMFIWSMMFWMDGNQFSQVVNEFTLVWNETELLFCVRLGNKWSGYCEKMVILGNKYDIVVWWMVVVICQLVYGWVCVINAWAFSSFFYLFLLTFLLFFINVLVENEFFSSFFFSVLFFFVSHPWACFGDGFQSIYPQL